MREYVLAEMERAAAFEDAERTFQMTEEAFRVFYEQTARPLWVYLARTTGELGLEVTVELPEAVRRTLDWHRRHSAG